VLPARDTGGSPVCPRPPPGPAWLQLRRLPVLGQAGLHLWTYPVLLPVLADPLGQVSRRPDVRLQFMHRVVLSAHS
jgi:hypothetical protein